MTEGSTSRFAVNPVGNLKRTVFLTLLMILLAGLVGIRTVGHDIDAVHVDPLTVTPPDSPNWYRVGPGLENESPVFDMDANQLFLEVFAVLESEDVEGIADTLEVAEVETGGFQMRTGWITVVDRSRIFGFPDYITISTQPVGDGSQSTIAIYSRSRFGRSDMGVNQERVERWLAALTE